MLRTPYQQSIFCRLFLISFLFCLNCFLTSSSEASSSGSDSPQSLTHYSEASEKAGYHSVRSRRDENLSPAVNGKHSDTREEDEDDRKLLEFALIPENEDILKATNHSSTPDTDYEEEKEPEEQRFYNQSVFTEGDTNHTEMFAKYYYNFSSSSPSESNGTSSNKTTLEKLSNGYRKATRILLDFPFPFYGHQLSNVTITTGGFLHVGDHSHSWLAATQYIAPLMANFNSIIEKNTTTSEEVEPSIHFAYTNDSDGARRRIVFEWSKVTLRDNTSAGPFTFQASLFASGEIAFVYTDIPVPIRNISDKHHPVKIGISDAYLFTEQTGNTTTESKPNKKKTVTIHEYHRVDIPPEQIKNQTVVLLQALPTCLDAKTCEDYQKLKIGDSQCQWCVPVQGHEQPFCTDQLGNNRKKQIFVDGGCQQLNPLGDGKTSASNNQLFYCPLENNSTLSSVVTTTEKPSETSSSSLSSTSEASTTKTTANSTTSTEVSTSTTKMSNETKEEGAAASTAPSHDFLWFSPWKFLLVVAVVSAALWLLYAYLNPLTPSGQLLIKYRPTRWSPLSSSIGSRSYVLFSRRVSTASGSTGFGGFGEGDGHRVNNENNQDEFEMHHRTPS